MKKRMVFLRIQFSLMLMLCAGMWAQERLGKGLLLQSSSPQGTYFCESESCRALDWSQLGQAPMDFKLYKNQKNEYLIGKDQVKWLWNASTGVLQKIPGMGTYSGVVAHIKNSISIAFEHQYSKTQIHYRHDGEKEKIFYQYGNWKTVDFQFLADGRHLFVVSPGMGKDESMNFVDIILDYPQSLYVAEDLGKKPVKILDFPKGDGAMDPHFVHEGKQIVYWRPGLVDKDSNRRDLYLEVVTLATKEVKRLASIKGPMKIENYFTRDTLDTIYFGNSPYVLFAPKNQQGRILGYVLINTITGVKKEINRGNGAEILIFPMDINALSSSRKRISYSSYLVFGETVSAGQSRLKVVSVPELDTVAEYTIPVNAEYLTADYLD